MGLRPSIVTWQQNSLLYFCLIVVLKKLELIAMPGVKKSMWIISSVSQKPVSINYPAGA